MSSHVSHTYVCVRVNESVVPFCSVNLYMWWAASPNICQIETGCSVLQKFKWSLTSFSCLTRHNERAAVASFDSHIASPVRRQTPVRSQFYE